MKRCINADKWVKGGVFRLRGLFDGNNERKDKLFPLRSRLEADKWKNSSVIHLRTLLKRITG